MVCSANGIAGPSDQGHFTAKGIFVLIVPWVYRWDIIDCGLQWPSERLLDVVLPEPQIYGADLGEGVEGEIRIDSGQHLRQTFVPGATSAEQVCTKICTTQHSP